MDGHSRSFLPSITSLQLSSKSPSQSPQPGLHQPPPPPRAGSPRGRRKNPRRSPEGGRRYLLSLPESIICKVCKASWGAEVPRRLSKTPALLLPRCTLEKGREETKGLPKAAGRKSGGSPNAALARRRGGGYCMKACSSFLLLPLRPRCPPRIPETQKLPAGLQKTGVAGGGGPAGCTSSSAPVSPAANELPALSGGRGLLLFSHVRELRGGHARELPTPYSLSCLERIFFKKSFLFSFSKNK